MEVECNIAMLCPECGNEQPDMGKGVRCENCGFYPLVPIKEGQGQ